MDDKKVFKNIGIGILIKPFSMVLSFIYVPIILSYLGNERYGAWVTISAAVTWFGMFDIGIGNGMRNKLSESVAVGNKQRSGEIVSTAYGVIAIIAMIILAIATVVCISFNIPQLMNIELKNDNVSLAMWVTCAFVCVNFILTLANTMTYSLQKSALVSICSVLIQMLNLLFVLFARKILTSNLVIIAFLYGSSTFIVNIALSIYLFKQYPELKPKANNWRRNQIRDITSLGVFFFVGQISSLVMNCTDNILVAKLFDVSSVTPYSSAYKLFTVILQIHGTIIMPMWAAYTRAFVKKEFNWIRKIVKQLNILSIGLSFGMLLLALFIRPISKLWLGVDLNYDTQMIKIMMLSFIVYLFINNYSTLLCGLSRVKAYTIVNVISSIMNIPVSIVLSIKFNMGLSGIILGTLLMQIPTLIVLIISARNVLKKLEILK